MEKNRPFTLARLAKENMRGKPLRSFFLLLMVFLFSFILLLGSLFMQSLAAGIARVSNRMGADLIVVPAGYKANIESILLKGEPSTFYLPADTLELLREQAGIAAMTPQLYIATLSASCCSYPVQIIGYDQASDFLVEAWLEETLHRPLADGEVLVGSHISGEIGDEIHFFNQPLTIAGRLEKTGMGFDGTVFVNLETARELARASQKQGVKAAADNSQMSVVLVRVKDGLDPTKVAASISQNYSAKGIFAMFSKSFVNDLAAKLKLLSGVILSGMIVLWLVALVILSFSFSAMIHERKRELSALRILGATGGQLRKTVLYEAGYLSLYGTILGVGVAVVFSLIAFPVLSTTFTIPLPTPSAEIYLIFSVMASVAGFITGPLASLPAAWRVSRQEAYTSMREAD